MTMQTNPMKDSDEWLDDILEGYANFKVWESQQEWKPDYDRAANIANSRNRAKAAIQAHYQPQAVGELRQALKDAFHNLYVQEFTTNWREQRLIRDIEIDLLDLSAITERQHPND